jgi:chemotaxis protein MotB
MPARYVLIGIWLIAFLFSACVSLPQYNSLEKDLKDARTENERTVNDLESRLNKAEEKVHALEIALSDSEAANHQIGKDRSGLEAQNVYLKKINQNLSDTNKALRQELNKKKSVIQLQEKVIGLLDDTKKTIENSLKDLIEAQQVEVVEENDTLKVIFIDKILFDSGSTELTVRGKELLQAIGSSLKGDHNREIIVEGHTDNVPLSASLHKRFPSNWELSTARAAAVVRFLQEDVGIEPARLSARGYSFYRPVASNANENGRRQNRRIEIILGTAGNRKN